MEPPGPPPGGCPPDALVGVTWLDPITEELLTAPAPLDPPTEFMTAIRRRIS